MPVQQRDVARQVWNAFAAGLLLASVGAQAEPLQLPTVKDAEQTRLLREADAQYQRYADSKNVFFYVDTARSGDWPCQVPAAQLTSLTGTSDYSAGDGPAGYGHRYTNVVVRPVSASCKAGKLDGQVELVYEAVRESWGPSYRGSSQQTGRVVAEIADGKVVHRLELRKSVEGSKDGGGTAIPTTAVASSAEAPVGDFMNSATILVTGDGSRVFLKRPVKTARGPRLEKAFYIGTTLIAVDHADANGTPDGLSVSYKGGTETKSCMSQGKPADMKVCGK